ncbi:MAG TPA: glycerophosphodiester phosphodiesterase family protein [Pseudogracilibacillus sp.]|nr:glycerophosphodiester phosphodiesterase family protein [Pseudogracilibacillus sp.]
MLTLIRNSLTDFKENISIYLIFEFIYSVFASLLIIPILTYTFNKIFMLIGKGDALLNSDVYQIGLSFNGLIGLFIIGFLAMIVLFLEFGTLILIGHKRYFNQSVSIADSFVTALKNLPKLIGFGVFPLLFLLLLGVPFLDVATLPSLLDINRDILFRELFQGSLLIKLMYLIIFLAIIYLYVRWIYVFHFIFIENKSVTQAVKGSWRLTKRHKLRLVLTFLLLNILFIVVSFLAITGLSQLGNLIESKIIGDFLGNYLQLAISYVSILLSLFFIPINVILLTRLYYTTLQNDHVAVYDQVELKKSAWLRPLEEIINTSFKRHKGWFITIIAVSITGVIFINGTIQNSIVYLPWDVEIAGHKGDGYHSPENSVSGVKSAIAKGVSTVEIDVTLTKDNVLVLSHDLDLQRIANNPTQIQDITYEEIKDVDIGSSFSADFAGEKIPSLDEILKITEEHHTDVIIDVKIADDEAIYASEIAKLVDKYDMEDLVSVQSFNPDFLQLMRKQNEEINLGQILYLFAGNLAQIDVDFYTVRDTMLTQRFVDHAKAENREIWVWTVNNQQDIKKVLSYDVDGIITDYPERVQQIIGVDEEE